MKTKRRPIREAAFYRCELERIAGQKRNTLERRLAASALALWDEVLSRKPRKQRCPTCGGRRTVTTYFDAGDHFSAGPAPESGNRTIPCPKCSVPNAAPQTGAERA